MEMFRQVLGSFSLLMREHQAAPPAKPQAVTPFESLWEEMTQDPLMYFLMPALLLALA